jgi:Domain of unknown function (DUF4262)
MCWKCDHPDGTIEEYLDEVRAKILKHGWAAQYVESDRTPYAYTIGLHARGLPELVVTGVSPQGALRLLNAVVRDVMSGDRLTPGRQMTPPAGPVLEIVQVDHPDAHMDTAIAIYGPQVRALQLVWADDRGRWPWAPGFSDARVRQPVLGVRAARSSR